MLDPEIASQALATFAPLLDADGIRATNDTTVVFKLKRPAWDLPALVADNRLGIVPPDPTRRRRRATPIGTGPLQGSRSSGPASCSSARATPTTGARAIRTPKRSGSSTSIRPLSVNGLRSGQFDLVTDLTALDAGRWRARADVNVMTFPRAS